MSNLVVIPGNKEDINKILNKDIKGIILGIKSLSIYPLELDIDSIIDIKNNTDKKVYVIINKMIHNNDLDIVREVINKINNSNIDGIIFLSSFPCGPDSLVNELAIRKLDDIPSIKITVDESTATSGLITRLESFVDILKARRDNG